MTTHTHTEHCRVPKSRDCDCKFNPLKQSSATWIICLYCFALEVGIFLCQQTLQPATNLHYLTSHKRRVLATTRPKDENWSTCFRNAIRHTARLGTAQRPAALSCSLASGQLHYHPVLYPIFPFVLLVFLVSDFHCSIFFHPSDFATSHACSYWIMHTSCLASYQAGVVRDQ